MVLLLAGLVVMATTVVLSPNWQLSADTTPYVPYNVECDNIFGSVAYHHVLDDLHDSEVQKRKDALLERGVSEDLIEAFIQDVRFDGLHGVISISSIVITRSFAQQIEIKDRAPYEYITRGCARATTLAMLSLWAETLDSGALWPFTRNEPAVESDPVYMLSDVIANEDTRGEFRSERGQHPVLVSGEASFDFSVNPPRLTLRDNQGNFVPCRFVDTSWRPHLQYEQGDRITVRSPLIMYSEYESDRDRDVKWIRDLGTGLSVLNYCQEP